MVVGASDRMITSGDVQFEPPQTKVFTFSGPTTSRVIALVAGDTAHQVEICRDTANELMKRTVVDVGEVAGIYASHFAAYRRRKAAQAILAPLGLDNDTFLQRQRELAPEMVARLTEKLQAYELEDDTIIAGTDSTGAHIYVVSDPGQASCQDGIGFAAIGSGYWHAESQFMFNEYTKSTSFPRAMFLTYSAKKRAEVAPDVGDRATDMFYIGPGLNYHTPLDESTLNVLNGTYQDALRQEKLAGVVAQEKFEKYVEDIINKQPPEQQETQGESDGEVPVEEGATDGETPKKT